MTAGDAGLAQPVAVEAEATHSTLMACLLLVGTNGLCDLYLPGPRESCVALSFVSHCCWEK